MNIDVMAITVPIIAVGLLFLVERFINRKQAMLDLRVKSIITIEVFIVLIGLVLSSVLLVPLVMLASNLQLFSINALRMPELIHFVLSFLLIDFIYYINHRVHHKVPFLWRLHRLHHSDKKVDVLTTWLHHPLEIVTTFIMVIVLFVVFDLPLVVMIVYGLAMGVHAAFTHLNILLPESVDKYLRIVMVTPNAHKVHHALNMKDGNSNFGALFLFWDWLLGTYQYRSNKELNRMTYGVSKKQSPIKNSLTHYLINPFK